MRRPGVDFVVDDPDRRAESVPLAEVKPEKEAVMVGQGRSPAPWMISRRRWGDGGVQGMIRMRF
jgi:hypothetical protein